MKKFFLILLALTGGLTMALGQGGFWFENLYFDVSVKTENYDGSKVDTTGPFVVSLWYLPGATSVPSNLTPEYDSVGNLISGGLYGMLADGYQQISPNFTQQPNIWDPGQFGQIFQSDELVTVPSLSPGQNAVLAVVGWTGTSQTLSQAIGAGEAGLVTFINPVGSVDSPSYLTGWDESGQDLLLIPYPIPEPSISAIFGVALVSLWRIRKSG